jgi:hypothetical protein
MSASAFSVEAYPLNQILAREKKKRKRKNSEKRK